MNATCLAGVGGVRRFHVSTFFDDRNCMSAFQTYCYVISSIFTLAGIAALTLPEVRGFLPHRIFASRVFCTRPFLN